MNILFLSNNDLDPEEGGLERTTYNLIRYLGERSEHRITICFNRVSGDLPHVTQVEQVISNGKQIADLIEVHRIDVAIFPGGHWYANLLKDYSKHISCKIVSCLHSPPRVGEQTLIGNLLLELKSKPFLQKLSALPRILYMVLRHPLYVQRVRKAYKKGYHNSDAYVLLSSAFFADFQDYARIRDSKKLHAIGNALSFAEVLDKAQIHDKAKRVLSVSRFYEVHKRIRLAIKAWHQVREKGEWFFHIMGYGKDEALYPAMIARYRVENISLLGRGNPVAHYRNARIFVMCSSHEGWGMTLTEAMQYGCVPVVMDSFASLHDIVQNGHNGIIVPNGDVDAMAAALETLMTDEPYWAQLSAQAIDSSQSFTMEKIGGKWLDLLETLGSAQD